MDGWNKVCCDLGGWKGVTKRKERAIIQSSRIAELEESAVDLRKY